MVGRIIRGGRLRRSNMNNLKSIMLKAGLTNIGLSKLSGIVAGHLSMLMSGRRANPTIQIAYTVARALHVSVYDVWPDKG